MRSRVRVWKKGTRGSRPQAAGPCFSPGLSCPGASRCRWLTILEAARRVGLESVGAASQVHDGGAAVPDSAESRERLLGLAHHWLELRIALRPELDEAGVVLDRTPTIALVLVDLCQPQLGRSGVQEIVRQAPIPRQRLV